MNRSDVMVSWDGMNKLDECLRAELSAAETYQVALRYVRQSDVARTLRRIHESHERRARALRERLRSAGGDLPRSSGTWGAVARLVQAGAHLLGDGPILRALEDGEERVSSLYALGVERCDPETRRLLEGDLRRQHEEAFALCRAIRKSVAAS